jgi:hypothetical protein
LAKTQQLVSPPLHPQSAEQLLADAYGAALADTAAVETAIASNESRKVLSLLIVIVILLLQRIHNRSYVAGHLGKDLPPALTC